MLASGQNNTKTKILKLGEKYLKQVNAKVDSLLLITEDPIPEIKLNTQHRFEITPCHLKYNGKEFRLGGTVQELVDVFGMYNRDIRDGDAYVWDDYGFAVLTEFHTSTVTEFTICFDCCEWVDPNNLKGTLPKSSFQGGILLDGVTIGRETPFAALKKQLKEKDSEVVFWGHYTDTKFIYRYNCHYDGDIVLKNKYDRNHAIIINTKDDGCRWISISDSRAWNKLQMQSISPKNKQSRVEK